MEAEGRRRVAFEETLEERVLVDSRAKQGKLAAEGELTCLHSVLRAQKSARM